MPENSKYSGELIDTSSRRSIVIMSSDGDGTAKPNEILVDFFYHDGEFWRARVPLDSVQQIMGQAFNFSKAKTRRSSDGREIVFNKHAIPKRTIPILQHVQSRFILKPERPVQLIRRDAEDDSPTHEVTDFVYSLEAVGPLGVGFGLRDGLTGNLISAHRFLSTREMVFERIVVENQYVTESAPLPLSADQMRQALLASLRRSDQAGMSEAYYLYRMCGTNNCTSSPFQIVDEVANYNWRQRVGSTLYRLPLSPRFYLRVRGLDIDPKQKKLVRHEFSEFINDAQTQQRKRDYVREVAKLRREARRKREESSS